MLVIKESLLLIQNNSGSYINIGFTDLSSRVAKSFCLSMRGQLARTFKQESLLSVATPDFFS